MKVYSGTMYRLIITNYMIKVCEKKKINDKENFHTKLKYRHYRLNHRTF